VRDASFDIGDSVRVVWDASDVHVYRRDRSPATESEVA
jgi:hypothetical protein